MTRRNVVSGLALIALLAVLSVPVLAGEPSGNGQAKNDAPKFPITLNGTIETEADADGETIYTLTDGTIWTLDAGPSWFYGDAHPLEPYVGVSVTIDGEVAEGSSDVDVLAIDGVALREPGKPPWAGGWKAVGPSHPGWSQEKADRFDAKFGGCWPPGHCKDPNAERGKPDKPDQQGGENEPDDVDEPDVEEPEATDEIEEPEATDEIEEPEASDEIVEPEAPASTDETAETTTS